MSRRCVALLRGINVGKAKRVSMAELRALFEGLGYRNVRTLLASGNVVFDLPPGRTGDVGTRVEEALAAHCGFRARTIVLAAAELEEILAGNALLDRVTDSARMMTGVLAAPEDRERLLPLLARDWGAEALAAGRRVAYYWCPEGILASPLAEAVGRALGDRITARNWATLEKLGALVAG
jgi:uncharacterized protein (DUF1697 family)